MVTLQILVLPFLVRVRVPQHKKIAKSLSQQLSNFSLKTDKYDYRSEKTVTDMKPNNFLALLARAAMLLLTVCGATIVVLGLTK